MLAIILIFILLGQKTQKRMESKTVYGVSDQVFRITEEYTNPSAVQGNGVLKFYSNGMPALSLLTTSGGPFYGTNGSHLMIDIPQYNESWTGDYTVASYADCHSVGYELYKQGCSSNSDIFLCYYLNIYAVLESILHLSISTLGKQCQVICRTIFLIHCSFCSFRATSNRDSSKSHNTL